MRKINMPDISVIIPVFRPVNFDTLKQSMAANADARVEWIIIDDGSGSGFDPVFSELEGTGAQVIRQAENRRQGAARNVGLARATGEWIKFLDADDQLDAGHLATLLEVAEAQSGKIIAFAPTKHIFANGTSSVNDSWRNLPPASTAQFVRQLVRPFLHHCGALFPRGLLLQLGGYDENLVTDEDGDLLLRILQEGYHFVPVETVNYMYIHHDGDGRVSSDDNIDKLQAREQVCKKIEAAFTDEIPDRIREALAQRLDKIAMSYWAAYPGEARALLSKAKALHPNYRPDMRIPLQLLRKLGGPSLMLSVSSAIRHFRGLPKGGAQG
jgi:glycosyltransferase involved in cell wall biosynthesis